MNIAATMITPYKKVINYLKEKQSCAISTRDRFILLGGIVFFLLFNTAPLISHYHVATGQQSIFHNSRLFFFYFITTAPSYLLVSLLLMAFLTASRFIFTVIGPVIFLLSGLIAYFIYYYNIVFTTALAGALLATNSHEISGLIGAELYCWLGIVTIIYGFFLYCLNKKREIHRLSPAYLIISLLLIIPLILYVPIGVPFNWIGSMVEYKINQDYLTILRQHKKNISAHTVSTNKNILDNLTIILVIGESARADHFHLNGYSRNTTPLLEKTPGLINFSQMKSCGNNTNTSVVCLLTRATRANMQPAYTETSLLSVFKALNFSTIWVSNNASKGEQNRDIKPIATSPEEVTESFSTENSSNMESVLLHVMYGTASHLKPLTNDSVLLPYLDKALQKYSGNVLVVLHTVGSHHPYYLHYPEAFSRFTPVCTKENLKLCDIQTVINGYDNSILFTDYFLHDVISRVKGRKSLVIYVSDHGELLGEDGYFGHLQPHHTGPEQYHVPMVWFVSDALQKAAPLLLPALTKHKDSALSHDTIFHSMLDCLGVKNKTVDKNLSLCR